MQILPKTFVSLMVREYFVEFESTMLRVFWFFCLLLCCHCSRADMSAIYTSDQQYLPTDVSYDPKITQPHVALGYTVGEWHVRPEQIVSYLQLLAKESPRVELDVIGHTHEQRPLLHLRVSSGENLQQLDSLREAHINNWQLSEEPRDLSSAPLVFWMGYSIHGDEASGANAALLLAYYLAAAQGEQVEQLLNNAVIIIDPAMNPDGLARFAQWANMHRGKNLVADPQHREHQQYWPSGRTNHYWFDLNRDWLLLTHPESVARIKQFHRWRPHVLTDFHEMGTNSSYFFQPGIPSRTNPHTPQKNIELTNVLATYHAASMDREKKLYFTKEAFDDFYQGKGSTYPDAHGSVGILFEQASARGHMQESENGMLSFSQTIQNQFNMSLSTFKGALANKADIMAWQDTFARETADVAQEDEQVGFVVDLGADNSKKARFLNILQQHQITAYPLTAALNLENQVFQAGRSVVVPLRQAQYRLIKSLFSSQKRFKDNTFYDVSNWNIAYAFNLPFVALDKKRMRKVKYSLSAAETSETFRASIPTQITDAVALAFNWQDSRAPALLQFLLQNGALVKQSQAEFSARSGADRVDFQAGAVVLPLGLKQPENLPEKLLVKARELNVEVHAVSSSLTPQGVDLGSRKLRSVLAPNILLLGGRDLSQYETGEIWHYLDTQVGIGPTIADIALLNQLELNRYSHIIAPDGNYSRVDNKTIKMLSEWLLQGGVMITQKRASRWAAEQNWLSVNFKERETINSAFKVKGLSFADQYALSAQKRIAGAVFETHVDLSHPLLFGFERETLPVFRTNTQIMRRPVKPFVTAISYTESPLLAGYAATEMEHLIKETAMAVAHKKGQGRIIGFTDNVTFRGYWKGTERLLSNAIYLSQFIDVEG